MSQNANNKISAVCILVTDLDAPSGGIQKNTKLLMREFSNRGVETLVCARNYYRLPSAERSEYAMIHRMPASGKSRAANGLLYLLFAFVWLIRNRNKFELIHCQQMFGPTMVAAVASYFIKKPIVTRVTTVGDLGEVHAIKQMAFSGLRRKLIKRVTRWVALTSQMKEEIESLGIPDQKIDIIYNSTQFPEYCAYSDVQKREMREALSLGYPTMGLFVGRLSEEKNLDILIRAWNKVVIEKPDAHLLVLGAGGSYRNVEDGLRQLVSELDLRENVHFLGHCDYVKDYLIASDIFLLPSRTEGMSNALVEAFACGASIIASDIKANAEICVNEVNSLLVEPGNVSALTDSILRLLDEREFANRLGKAARKQAEDTLSVDTMVAAYLETYKMALRAVN
ncbi:MAG: glycosyltransferase family 4 protein [Pyrinomonadaceae bacterium]|nr:glycosyltransferase family 4 protein [Pyrinomonadaceae bacterium]